MGTSEGCDNPHPLKGTLEDGDFRGWGLQRMGISKDGDFRGRDFRGWGHRYILLH